MESTVLPGIALHAFGGVAAACCYVSQKWATGWSFHTYWIVVCTVAWLLMPLLIASATTPELWGVLTNSPPETVLKITLLGAAYGFGGMAFGVAIRHIGYSLTYAIAIGISAVFGTLVPALLAGTLISDFQKPGGFVVLTGFAVSIAGVALCGRAGFMKERELQTSGEKAPEAPSFNMKFGLLLVIIAGLLAGIYGVAVSGGTPIDEVAVAHGASEQVKGYAKYIFITGGALLTNLLWWGVVHARQKTFGEFRKVDGGMGRLGFYYLMGIIGGALWFGQFIFYEQGHVRMGEFKFISWGIHMAMLVFFSFGVGLAFREWNQCRRPTLLTLAAGLLVLLGSFGLITWGSSIGEQAKKGNEQASQVHSTQHTVGDVVLHYKLTNINSNRR